jgi:hypothetical protein
MNYNMDDLRSYPENTTPHDRNSVICPPNQHSLLCHECRTTHWRACAAAVRQRHLAGAQCGMDKAADWRQVSALCAEKNGPRATSLRFVLSAGLARQRRVSIQFARTICAHKGS